MSDDLLRTAEEEGYRAGYAGAAQRILSRVRHAINAIDGSSPVSDEIAFVEAKRLLDTLPSKARRRVLKEIREDLREQKRENDRNLHPIQQDLAWLKDGEPGVIELEEWTGEPFRLGKPPTAMFHKFREALGENKVYDLSRIKGHSARVNAAEWADLVKDASVFIVEHDWAAAFANAGDYVGGEYKLPDEVCAFEFRINGKHVIAVAIESSAGVSMEMNVLTVSGWMMTGHLYLDDGKIGWTPISRQSDAGDKEPPIHKFAALVGGQIRAIAVALDAEVATSGIVRAPHKLNHARERRGKLPISSYHVVSLARRSRAPRLESDQAEPGTYTKKRLHFRRGHWRHFENHKTWIKWMLVGDPDLGFVDKHYKL